MSPSIEQLSHAYLDAWSRRDLQGIAALIHPDISFRSPNGQIRGSEAYLAAAGRMLPLLERIDVNLRLHGPDSAMFIYDFVCQAPIGVARTAEAVRFKDGLVCDSEVLFDPRSFQRAAPPAAVSG